VVSQLITPKALEAEHFHVRYPEAATAALNNLTLSLEPGERVLLLGPSGSGKSTFVATLVGLVPHSTFAEVDGELKVYQQSLWDSNPADLSQSVGVVFQEPDSQLTMLTVREEIAFGLENRCVDPEKMDDRIHRALQQVGLTGREDMAVDQLSGGMKQRLVIAALLAMEPRILVLDEPTSNLDPQGVQEITAVLATLAETHRDMTIIIIEHQLDPILPLIERVLVLDESGALIADGTKEEVFSGNLERLGNIWLPTPLTAQRHTVNGTRWQWSSPALPLSEATVGSRSPEILSLQDISFSYRRDQPILKNVSLSLYPGEICALVGRNGSGKSTLASLAVGIRSPDAGTVHLGTTPLCRIEPGERAQRIGYVFQNPEHQFVRDTVFEEVRYNPHPITDRDVERTLTALRLSTYGDRNPFSLSHGQKRRLSAATMLVAPKEVLVMDEPTFGQDPAALEELVQMITALATAGTAVILVTHDMNLVWRAAHRVVVLHQGVIIGDDNPPSLFKNSEVCRRGGIHPPLIAHYHQNKTSGGV